MESCSQSYFIEGSDVDILDVAHFLDLLNYILNRSLVFDHATEDKFFNAIGDFFLFTLSPDESFSLDLFSDVLLEVAKVNFCAFWLNVQNDNWFLIHAFFLLWLSGLLAWLLECLLHCVCRSRFSGNDYLRAKLRFGYLINYRLFYSDAFIDTELL